MKDVMEFFTLRGGEVHMFLNEDDELEIQCTMDDNDDTLTVHTTPSDKIQIDRGVTNAIKVATEKCYNTHRND